MSNDEISTRWNTWDCRNVTCDSGVNDTCHNVVTCIQQDHSNLEIVWIVMVATILVAYLFAVHYLYRSSYDAVDAAPTWIIENNKRVNELSKALSSKIIDETFIFATDQFLGSGVFGIVYKGVVMVTKERTRLIEPCAAAFKVSHPCPSAAVKMLEEAERMADLDHDRIVRLIGVSFKAFRPLLALEFLDGGSLTDYFQARAKQLITLDAANRPPEVRTSHMVRVLNQVAEAIEYLHSRGMEHKDVAARNVLLTEHNLAVADAKLGDFGLSQQRVGFCNSKKAPVLPIAWLPPEVICCIPGGHTTESDVWMFGVLCWECVTLGGVPHRGKSQETIRQDILNYADLRLAIPPEMQRDFHKLMLECWNVNVTARPTFLRTSSTANGKRLLTISERLGVIHECLVNQPQEDVLLEDYVV